jgi:hypothetical protein
VPYVKPGCIQRPPVSITCWPGGMPRRCRPCNWYRSMIRDSVLTTGSIMATAAVLSFSAGDGHRSNLVNLERKRPTSARRTDRQDNKSIGGGTDEDPGKDTVCYRCCQPGHFVMDCPHPHPGQASNQGEPSTSKGPSVSLITPTVQLVTTRSPARMEQWAEQDRVREQAH